MTPQKASTRVQRKHFTVEPGDPLNSWTRLIADRPPSPLLLGCIASALIALGSFGAGAVRYKGGILRALNLEFFSFGHGASISNCILWAGLILFVFAWCVAGLRLATINLQRTLVAWVAPLLFAAPILSRDVYSYLMQGAMLRDGFNPYREGAAINPGAYLLEVSHDWRNTTTPYGPLHLWIGEGVTRIAGENVTVGVILYKVISVIGFLLIAWSVPRIAQAIGGNPQLALWLGVLNPVVIFHMVGGMHNESLVVGLVNVGILWATRKHPGWIIAAVAIISVSVSLKASAVIALPFVVWMATNCLHERWGIHRAASFFASGFVLAAETLGIVALVTKLSGASWEWISQVTGNSKVIDPLAAPSLIAGLITPFGRLVDPSFSYNALLDGIRTITSILMLLGLVIAWWVFRSGTRRNVMGTVAAYGSLMVFNSVTLPWYYASPTTLIGTFTPPRWLVRFTIAASITVGLAFAGSGNHHLYNGWIMVPLICISIVIATVLERALSRQYACRRTT